MDLKITKKRFEAHWAYDWIKYIAVILICVLVVPFFYQVTTYQLKDKEELRLVFFGNYVGELKAYNTKQGLNEYIKSVGLNDSVYLDHSFHPFAKLDDSDAYEAATIKLEGEKELDRADIFVLPKIDKGTYLTDVGSIKDGAGYTFDMYVGMHRYFIPIDELVQIECDRGNPVAIELKAKLQSNDYYYNCASRSVDASLTKFDVITEVYTETIGDNGVIDVKNPNAENLIIKRNFGIDLNKLDTTKSIHLIRDDADTAKTVCNYVLGVKRTSGSYAEAVCFINWLIDNYTQK